MIANARAELLALAAAARGQEWAAGLEQALAAAQNAGWSWERAGALAARLVFAESATPRDLAEAARSPVVRRESEPPSAEWMAARKELARRAS